MTQSAELTPCSEHEQRERMIVKAEIAALRDGFKPELRKKFINLVLAAPLALIAVLSGRVTDHPVEVAGGLS